MGNCASTDRAAESAVAAPAPVCASVSAYAATDPAAAGPSPPSRPADAAARATLPPAQAHAAAPAATHAPAFPGPAVLDVIERQFPGMQARIQTNINAMTPGQRRMLARANGL
jgi:hypothetical protein